MLLTLMTEDIFVKSWHNLLISIQTQISNRENESLAVVDFAPPARGVCVCA